MSTDLPSRFHLASRPVLARAALLLGAAAFVALGARGADASNSSPPAAHDLDPAHLLPPLAATPTPVLDGPSAGTATFQLSLKLPPANELAGVLIRSGASAREAQRAVHAVRAHFLTVYNEGDDLELGLSLDPDGQRKVETLALLGDYGRHALVRQGERLARAPEQVQIERRTVDGSAYWVARKAGLNGNTAAALAAKLRELGTIRRAQFVVGARPDRFDGSSETRLLYLVAETGSGRQEYLREGNEWIAVAASASEEFFMRPARGRISSTFGWRAHPILGFSRPHNGIDIAAGWGAPVYAAADGVVTGSGWRGGYGRQVRIAHAGATETSYSHLSATAVGVAAAVRRGQLIGYVGASGLATGPHLHFELRRRGNALDPLGAVPIGSGTMTESQVRRLSIVRGA